jgi:hypothetical protein
MAWRSRREVLAAKAEDGKGAKVVGKFVHFTDSELLNKATAKHNKLGLLCATFPMPEGYKSRARWCSRSRCRRRVGSCGCR